MTEDGRQRTEDRFPKSEFEMRNTVDLDFRFWNAACDEDFD
jgi:hypothetical protein